MVRTRVTAAGNTREGTAMVGIIGGADGPTAVWVSDRKRGRVYRTSNDTGALSRSLRWTAAAFGALLFSVTICHKRVKRSVS